MKKFRCAEFSKDALCRVKEQMFKTTDCHKQNVFMSQLLRVQTPKHTSKNFTEKPRSVSVSYLIPNGKDRIQCAVNFLKVSSK